MEQYGAFFGRKLYSHQAVRLAKQWPKNKQWQWLWAAVHEWNEVPAQSLNAKGWRSTIMKRDVCSSENIMCTLCPAAIPKGSGQSEEKDCHCHAALQSLPAAIGKQDSLQ